MSDPQVHRFLEALTRRDFDTVRDCLDPNVWLRALLPKITHETTTAEDATATYQGWYGDALQLDVLSVEHSSMDGRECVRYRFRVLPSWAPHEWHVIEQVGFCRVRDGLIRRIDIVCSGFQPVREASATATAA